MNKTLIALVLVVGLSGSVFGNDPGFKQYDPKDYEGITLLDPRSPKEKRQEAEKELLKKRYDQCQTIKQKLYDDCILKNLKTSDTTSANLIRNICKRKSEDIPLSTAIFYKDFYVYGFDFCDIKEDPDKYYERLERMFESDEDRLKRKKRMYPDIYD